MIGQVGCMTKQALPGGIVDIAVAELMRKLFTLLYHLLCFKVLSVALQLNFGLSKIKRQSKSQWPQERFSKDI